MCKAFVGSNDPRQPEVHQVYFPVRVHHHVAGLHIAVNNIQTVRVRECIRQPSTILRGPARVRHAAVDFVFQRLALDVCVGDEILITVGARVVHRNNVGMPELRGRLAFEQETCSRSTARRNLTSQHL